MLETPNFMFCLDDNLETICKEQNLKYNTDFKVTDFLPKQATSQDTGYDVRCAEPNGIILKPYRYIKIPLGFKVFSPFGWWLKLVPRSSTLLKKHIHALYGVIDEGFEANCFFVGQYQPANDEIVKANGFRRVLFGERIAQLIPVYRQKMNYSRISSEKFKQLCEKRGLERGTGGFGSTKD